ncbi:MAG: (Fe-S)-binding protein [Cyclobacteriaceae bacterium]
MKVQLFIPCFVDQLFPETAFNMVKILEKLGCEVGYNPNQTCCGQPAFNAGYWDECRAVTEKFHGEFDSHTPVVAPGGSCVGYLRNYYHKLFEAHDLPVNGMPQLEKFYEFTEFLTEELSVSDVGASLEGVAVYHDACGALRECGIREAPRKLLSNVKGLELRETGDSEVCCGFGGTFAVKFEPISVGMAEQKVNNAVKQGAEYIISTDSSCLLQLNGYIRRHNIPIRTMHIVDVLANGW